MFVIVVVGIPQPPLIVIQAVVLIQDVFQTKVIIFPVIRVDRCFDTNRERVEPLLLCTEDVQGRYPRALGRVEELPSIVLIHGRKTIRALRVQSKPPHVRHGGVDPHGVVPDTPYILAIMMAIHPLVGSLELEGAGAVVLASTDD